MRKNQTEPYISTYLHTKGRQQGLPIAGNFELTARCNFNCPMCYVHLSESDAQAKGQELTASQWLQIAKDARDRGMIFALLTGGEPCRHDLTELTSRLVAEGFRVQIETSGTMPIRCHADVWVTLSPKLDMPGGLAVRQDAWERAGEIKFPVDTAADLARFEHALAAARKAAARPLTELVWLQPVSQGKEATRLCVEAAFAHQWRVSVQVHKYLDLR